MSSIGLDLTPLSIALAIGGASPLLGAPLSWRLAAGSAGLRRAGLAGLGALGPAGLAGAVADRLLRDREIAGFSVVFTAALLAIGLPVLLLRRGVTRRAGGHATRDTTTNGA